MASDFRSVLACRVRAVSQTRGTMRTREDSLEHEEAANQVWENTGGPAGIHAELSQRSATCAPVQLASR
jgi:hypothetical protein